MIFQHKTLANGRWKEFSFLAQMANIGSEVERALKQREKSNEEYSQMAFIRSLELIDLTLACQKNKSRLFELARVREVWASYFTGGYDYGYSSKAWKSYFFNFALANSLSLGM